jgi:predicted nucleotidyltransferase
MLEKYSRYKLLREFFVSPTKNFQMRELSRKTKISPPSVINHLNFLLKENLIIREKNGIYPSYKANRENDLFKIYKKNDLILQLESSGFLNYIYDLCLPNSIILFGSASKGEDIETSDIDLFIQSPEKKINLDKYEKIFKREISLFFEEDFSRLPSELKNNVINGLIIKGYLKVFDGTNKNKS